MINLCRFCKKEEGVINDCTNKFKSKLYKYFACRNCNNLRARLYRDTETGKKVYRKIMERQCLKHKVKIKARAELNFALKKGLVSKPSTCSKCSLEKKIEGHHEDYSKPLEVIWVCRQCHLML